MKGLFALILIALLSPTHCRAQPNAQAAAGNAAYARKAYSEAVDAYREGLLDQPDSLLLRFNLGAALYSLANYEEAAAAFTTVAASGDEEWIARAAYNLGNSLYRIGESKEASDPKAAVESYQQALLVYRRAMAADAEDTDAKYGHEFVARKLKQLLERQAEQQQQDQQGEQQQQDQQGEQQQQDQGGEQPPEQEQGQDQGQEQEQQQQAQGDEQQQQESTQGEQSESSEEQDQTQQSASEGASEEPQSEQEKQQSLDRQAARAILDTASAEELGPEDISRALGVAGDGRPAKDW